MLKVSKTIFALIFVCSAVCHIFLAVSIQRGAYQTTVTGQGNSGFCGGQN